MQVQHTNVFLVYFIQKYLLGEPSGVSGVAYRLSCTQITGWLNKLMLWSYGVHLRVYAQCSRGLWSVG